MFPEGAKILVPPNHQGPSLLAHEVPARHPPRPEVRQHLHHRTNRVRQNRGPRIGHSQKQVFRKVCHR